MVENRPRPSTVAHLDALTATGADGWLALSYMNDADKCRSRSFHVSEVDAAAQWARDLDDAGRNVYVRSSLLRRPLRHEGERGENVDTGTVVALAVDLDIDGPGHNHNGPLPLPPDIDTAMGIVAPLPAPTLNVDTGGGVHLWWLLDEPEVDEPVAVLEAWAARIVEAGRQLGWRVDRPDPARVLRVCGTHRRKVDRSTGEQLCNRVTLADVAGWPHHGLEQRPWCPTARYGAPELLEVLPEPAAPAPLAVKPERRLGEYGPADAVGELSWSEILTPAGFELVGHSSIDGTPVELWRRPGSCTSEYSLKAVPGGPAIVWSDAIGLESGRGYSPWQLFVHLHHGGDQSAAARTIRALSREVVRV